MTDPAALAKWLDADGLAAALETGLARRGAAAQHECAVHVRERVGSTIDACRELADRGAPEGTAVVALAQDAGRGQRGHAWHSPRGGLYASVLLRPSLEPRRVGILTPLTGLAVRDALRDLGVAAELKRPNDLVLEVAGRWRKVGGVLVDVAVQGPNVRHVIASAGVNVTLAQVPVELRDVATSLADACREPLPLQSVAASVLGRLAALASVLADADACLEIVSRHEREALDVEPGDPVAAPTGGPRPDSVPS